MALRQGSTASGQGAAILADLPSLHAVLSLLKDRLEPPYTGTRRAVFDGSVELSGVSFGYDERLVLGDVALNITPGEVVALVGPNGSGKSTLASLLLGLYAPSAGSIRMGGRDIAELDLVHLRSQIGVVEQEPVLLPASLRANIAWGRPNASDSEILEAAARAGALEIRGLDVLDADVHVGEDGTRLSGGQRQRIVVARALLGNPKLLILDEPTNHLDAEAVGTLLRTLSDLDPVPAVLIITHDVAVAAHAHRQYVLRGGKVVNAAQATGPPLMLGSGART
jgi:ABC-type bacteriocin/lantibiotic exporter with double-glycine peptidase domain